MCIYLQQHVCFRKANHQKEEKEKEEILPHENCTPDADHVVVEKICV